MSEMIEKLSDDSMEEVAGGVAIRQSTTSKALSGQYDANGFRAVNTASAALDANALRAVNTASNALDANAAKNLVSNKALDQTV